MPGQVSHATPILARPIRVAVLGAGAREHALAWKIAQSPLCEEVIVLPGNPGMQRSGLRTEPAELSNPAHLAQTLRSLGVGFVVVGPDDWLAAGIVDALSEFKVFGPTREAAKLEWSKNFAKEIMVEAGVPTARHARVDVAESRKPELAAGLARALGGYPLVLKYDGLALGKGVQICENEAQARDFLSEVFEERKFRRGAQDDSPVVLGEQFLRGREVSLFAITDGETYECLAPACDHKRLLDGNKGPNTGGMGAYSPVPWLSAERVAELARKVFPPVLAAMRARGTPFRGLLYAGLMVDERSDAFWVLEFNARFGDPETQAILPRMDSDLLPVLYAAATGALAHELKARPVRWSAQACVNVVAASRGYPEKAQTGDAIRAEFNESAHAKLFFAGVKQARGGLVTSGGRVLGVSALGQTLEAARKTALEAIEKQIHFEGMQFRRDIAGA